MFSSRREVYGSGGRINSALESKFQGKAEYFVQGKLMVEKFQQGESSGRKIGPATADCC